MDETCPHFKTDEELQIKNMITILKKNNKSHLFKRLHSTSTWFDSRNSLSFKIIDKAKSKFDLKFFFLLFNNFLKNST